MTDNGRRKNGADPQPRKSSVKSSGPQPRGKKGRRDAKKSADASMALVKVPVGERHSKTWKSARKSSRETWKAAGDFRMARLKHQGKDQDWYLQCDPAAINEALTELGCEVRLRWTTEQVKLSNGKTQNRYHFQRGRFRLGQKTSTIARKDLYGSARGASSAARRSAGQ